MVHDEKGTNAMLRIPELVKVCLGRRIQRRLTECRPDALTLCNALFGFGGRLVARHILTAAKRCQQPKILVRVDEYRRSAPQNRRRVVEQEREWLSSCLPVSPKVVSENAVALCP